MSDSGFSGLPPSIISGDVSVPQKLIELKARIIALKGELKAQKVVQKLEGEIIRHNPDGTSQIKTDKGEVTVEFKGRNIPPEGTRVQIEIPPADRPQQVIVRPLPAQPTTQEPPKQEAAPPKEARPADRAPPRLDIRSAEELARAVERTPAADRRPVEVKPDTIIRLLPLPDRQLADLIAPNSQTLAHSVTRLPPLPQIQIEDALYQNISKALTLPLIDHAQLHLNLPQPLPLHTQNTAQPVPLSQLDNFPAPVRTAVQNLVQYIAQANAAAQEEPFAITPRPVQITPALATQLDQPQIATKQNPGAFTPTPITEQPAQSIFLTGGQTQDFANPFAENKPLDLRIRNIVPPQIKIVAPAADGNAAQATTVQPHALSAPLVGGITGEVIGTTPQELPVLSFFLPGFDAPKNFVMQFAASNLPAGTQVQATPMPGTLQMAQQTGAQAAAPFIPQAFFSDFQWPAMDELNRTLQSMAPQAAQVLSNVTANAAAPARLPMAALFFIAAIRSGDISGWLGDKTVDTLKRIGKGDLLSRLQRDVTGLQRAAEPSAQEWRTSALPMMWEGEMHKMMLYYRHDRDSDNDNEDSKRGTRFIFDLNLDRMGDVQLDGLHRPGKLDLIVRTNRPFSEPMQQYMKRTYKGALGQAEISGELSFQSKPEQFIKIDVRAN